MLGIVILNYKAWEETQKCVESVYKTFKGNFKIIIVDNCSPNDSYNKLKDLYKNQEEIICLQASHNGGFSKGNNIGIRACEELGMEYVLVCNSDIIFNEGCIDRLFQIMQENPNTLQAAPGIVDTNGRTISLPWKERQSLLQYLHLKKSEDLIVNPGQMGGMQKVYMVSGGCFILNIKLFAQIGYFDEGVFLYNEEGILSAKARKAGYDVIFDHRVTVIHNHGASTEKNTLFADAEIVKSGLYYWKHYEQTSDCGLVFIYLIMTLRMTLKVLLGRVKSEGYGRYRKECFKALKRVLRERTV